MTAADLAAVRRDLDRARDAAAHTDTSTRAAVAHLANALDLIAANVAGAREVAA